METISNERDANAQRVRNAWLSAPQKHLGVKGLMALLCVANLLVPFSVDIYTPSLPDMPAYFGTSESTVSLTLALFYLTFAVSLLVFGTMSDSFGRKSVLVSGNLVYIVGSVACAFSSSIGFLIAARIVQAIGAGAVYAVATALVSDCFTKERRGFVLTIMQVLFVIGPIVAPLAGGAIILFGTWHEVFAVLAVLGLICLAGSFLFTDNRHPKKAPSASSVSTLVGLASVLRNPRFLLVLLVMSLFNMAFMAYVAAGAYIYVGTFGQTQQLFTCFFAGTAAVSALGPIAFQKFCRGIDAAKFSFFLIILSLASGIAMLAVGDSSVWVFTALCVVLCASTMTIRPYTIGIMLHMNENRAGAASSVLNFVSTALGAAGMIVVTLFDDFVSGFAIIIVFSTAVSLILWSAFRFMDRQQER